MVSFRRYARDWRKYLACGGLLLVIILATVHALNERKNAQGGHYKAKYYVNSRIPFAVDPTCESTDDSHKESGCVEWQTMAAARAQATWTAATFFLGILGLAGVYFTLRTSIAATEATKVSADAAKAAADAAVKTAELTRRIENPNLILVSAKEAHAGSHDYSLSGFAPEITFMNVGARPAIVTGECIQAEILEFEPPKLFRTSRHFSRAHPKVVPHMETCEISRFGYSESAFWQAQIPRVLKGNLALWVWGYIEFKGLGDRPERRRFRYNVIPVQASEEDMEHLYWRLVPFEDEEPTDDSSGKR